MSLRVPIAATPVRCPHGHRLGRGLILWGWRPCLCAGARDLGRLGHTTQRCIPCLDGGKDIVRLEPPCAGEEARDASPPN